MLAGEGQLQGWSITEVYKTKNDGKSQEKKPIFFSLWSAAFRLLITSHSTKDATPKQPAWLNLHSTAQLINKSLK